MQSDLSVTGTLPSHRMLDMTKIQGTEQELDVAVQLLLAQNVRVFLSQKERKVTISVSVNEQMDPMQMARSWFSIQQALPNVRVVLQQTEPDPTLGSTPSMDGDWQRYEDYLYAACTLLAAKETGLLPLLKNVHWTVELRVVGDKDAVFSEFIKPW